MTPAIVVIAFNRPAALARLLASLARARYPDGVDVRLVISIDHSASGIDAGVARLAHDFEWTHGAKEVVEQPAHLGVVRHFEAAGALAVEHGAAILLEDDLVVSPAFHAFAGAALDRYADDERIGGVCLYGLWFNGFTRQPFQPIEDGNDVFFLRLPYTQGLAFTAAQWQRLAPALSPGRPPAHRDLHPAFQRFGADEWFPAFAHYLAVTGRVVCFPRVSLTTGWGDEGAHFAGTTAWLQTALQLGAPAYRMPALDEALAVYDGFFELLPERLRALGAALPDAGFDVDLNATKRRTNLQHDLVLTTRPVRRAVQRFGLRLQPAEANVISAVKGDDIALARVDDVYWDAIAGLEARRRLEAFAWARHKRSRRRELVYAVARFLQSRR